jgi:hypothetical protein
MDTLMIEIDALRQKLETLISGDRAVHLSENAIMECSQELDNLITRYYREIISIQIHNEATNT